MKNAFFTCSNFAHFDPPPGTGQASGFQLRDLSRAAQ
jgi:hypothetical protein